MILKVKITPRSKKNEINGYLSDGTLKIRLTAPPVDGKANEALVDLLSNAWNIPKGVIKIVSGQTGRTKFIEVPDHLSQMLRSINSPL